MFEDKLQAPIYVEISPTGICNHKCLFCHYNYLGHEGKFKKGKMLKLIRELASMGVKSIVFAGNGEPTLHVDTIDSIKLAKMVNTLDAFRLLFFVKDYAFAQNLGQYYVDNSVKENKVYEYRVEAYRGKKRVFVRAVIVHTYKQPKRYDFMWVKAKNTNKGIELTWDISKEYNYYNVYRKKEGKKLIFMK